MNTHNKSRKDKIEKIKVTQKVYWPNEQDIEIRMSDKVMPDDDHHSHINEENLIEVLEDIHSKLNEIIDKLNNL